MRGPVAFADVDEGVTRLLRPGHVSISLVSHGPSPAPGHGVGVTILLSGPVAALGWEIRASSSPGQSIVEMAQGNVSQDRHAAGGLPQGSVLG